MAEPDRITDKSTLHRYRVELPILLDDMDLTVYAFRLYIHMKRRAGDDGSCWEGTRALAKACRMSLGQVAKAKKELKDKGLITIEKYKTPTGDGDNVSIVDLWPKNFETYGKTEESVHTVNATTDEAFTTRTESVHTVNAKRSYSEQERSRGGSEEDPMKKIPIKRERESRAQAPAVVLFFEFYPGKRLSEKQIHDICSTATDLSAWRQLLTLWSNNDWKPLVGNLLDRYRKDMERNNGSGSTQTQGSRALRNGRPANADQPTGPVSSYQAEYERDFFAKLNGDDSGS